MLILTASFPLEEVFIYFRIFQKDLGVVFQNNLKWNDNLSRTCYICLECRYNPQCPEQEKIEKIEKV